MHEAQINARPAAFHLAQNFPNPFNQSTVIRIDLETRAEMELAVYNISGQKVATLAQGPYPSGEYTFTWDGRNTPRGRIGFRRLLLSAQDQWAGADAQTDPPPLNADPSTLSSGR